MPLKSLGLVSILVLSLTVSFQSNLQAGTHKNKEYHSIHLMMNHGLTMVLEGSSLIMMAEMEIDTTVKKDPIIHGNAMIAEGKALLNRALRGPVMVEKHVQGEGTTEMMIATHQLGEMMLKTIYKQGIMQPAIVTSETAKYLHVLHLEADHALVMAAQGSNMVMIGQSDPSNDLNRFSIEHGQKMMSSARSVLHDLLSDKSFSDLENKKLGHDEAMYKYTKEQLINSVEIVNLLIQMEFE